MKIVNLNFATVVTINDAGKSIQITGDELEELINICEGIATTGSPSCGFGRFQLIFEGNGKVVTIYPTCDTCSQMQYGQDYEYFYMISLSDREKLVKILEKYDIKFPCV